MDSHISFRVIMNVMYANNYRVRSDLLSMFNVCSHLHLAAAAVIILCIDRLGFGFGLMSTQCVQIILAGIVIVRN